MLSGGGLRRDFPHRLAWLPRPKYLDAPAVGDTSLLPPGVAAVARAADAAAGRASEAAYPRGSWLRRRSPPGGPALTLASPAADAAAQTPAVALPDGEEAKPGWWSSTQLNALRFSFLRCDPSSGPEADRLLATATGLSSSWALNRLLLLLALHPRGGGHGSASERRRYHLSHPRGSQAPPSDADGAEERQEAGVEDSEEDSGGALGIAASLRSRRAVLWGQAIFDALAHPKQQQQAQMPGSSSGTELLNVHVCTTLITLFGRHGQWTAARRVYDWMRVSNVLPNNFTYCALISAFERGGQFAAAMAVLQDMDDAKCPPNDVVLATLLIAAARGGRVTDLQKIVARMKSDGIVPDVVAVTTSLSLCARSEQANKAAHTLALFEQLLEAGLQPTTTMYNILISACDKAGHWKRALEYLGQLRSRQLKPDLVTYNSLLSALEREQQAEAAEECLRALKEEGLRPQIRTYNALIAACDRTANLARAMHWFEAMRTEGIHPDVVTYNALISCCDKAGRWDTALQMVDRMRSEGLAPNTITFSSAIAACEKGGEWERALALFDDMPAAGCAPNGITYNSLISACAAGDQWGTALEAYHRMRAAGLEADRATYNPLLNALWSGGQFALSCDLMRRALDDGLYDPPFSDTPSAATCDLHSMSSGAAHAALAIWVSHLRDRYISPQADSSSSNGSMAPVAVPPPPSFHVITGWGKHSRRHGVSEVKIAITDALRTAGSPFRVAGPHNTGMLTATAEEAMAWLHQIRPEDLYMLDEAPVSSSSVAATRRQLLDENNAIGPGEMELQPPPPPRRFPRQQILARKNHG